MTNFNVLQNNLEELSLFKMNEILPNVIEKSIKSNTALQDSLIELTDAEIAFRDERARKINITVSHFPYIKRLLSILCKPLKRYRIEISFWRLKICQGTKTARRYGQRKKREKKNYENFCHCLM